MAKYDAAKGPEQEPDAEPPPVDPEKPDLRRSTYEKDNIRVERNLNSNMGGDGHIARGNLTRFQSLNFSVRGRPADPGERDPVFMDREAGTAQAGGTGRADESGGRAKAGGAVESDKAGEPVASAHSVVPHLPDPPVSPAPSAAPGLVGALKRLFGG